MGYGDSNHCRLPECRANLSAWFPLSNRVDCCLSCSSRVDLNFCCIELNADLDYGYVFGHVLDPCIHYYEIVQEYAFSML